LYVGAEVEGVFLRMLPSYADATGWLALERMASLRPAFLGTSTLFVASGMAVGLLGLAVWLAAQSASRLAGDRTS
jgi:hypothetical protein